MKFRQKGKTVVTDDGVVRVRGSKSVAKKTAIRLNELDASKQHGRYVPPENSYWPTARPETEA